MKNKKLFAILTLVCFMFTLMPVAAFATTADYYVVGNGESTKDTITVDTEERFTLTVNDGGATEYYFWAEDGDGKVVALETTSGSSVNMDLDVVGTYYVYAVTGVDLSSKIATDTKGEIVEWVKDMYEDNIVDECLTVKVKAADNDYYFIAEETTQIATEFYQTGENAYTLHIGSNNGWNEDGELKIFLYDDSDEAVKGEEIKFSTSSPYVSVDVEDDITNRNGKVEIAISAVKYGTYKVYANHEDADRLTITVKVGQGDVKTVETIAQPAGKVALDTDFSSQLGYSGVAFEFRTSDGAIIDNVTDLYENGTVVPGEELYKIALVEAPADSDLDADNLTLVYDNFTNDAFTLYSATESFDEEGTYKFKVSLENGASATATVTVAEFAEPVRMILTMMENTAPLADSTYNYELKLANGTVLDSATSALLTNSYVTVKAVTYLDANGVTLSSNHVDFDEYGVVEFAANGKAVHEVIEATDDADNDTFVSPDEKGGTVFIVAEDDSRNDDDKLIGTTITVYAINDELEMTATANITIVDDVDGLVFEETTADVAVTNKLIVNTVDANGDVVSAGLNDTTTTVSAYVLSAPANAVYGIDADVTDVDEVTVEFTASVAGEYEVQVIVREAGKYYSTTETIVVGGTAGQFEDVVVMSIGANNIVVNSDVKEIAAAPMIKDARTFVPFRALAEAFGAEVEWVEATQSVVAELNGVKVVMVIGEAAYTVNGVEKTADVAPFINGASTMVPVRFVAEAFGINVTPLYAADGTVADVLFAK